MNQHRHPHNSEEQPSNQQQSLGDVQVKGDDNIFNVIQAEIVTLTQNKIIQISVDKIKTRPFISTSPYKGLRRFEAADRDRFFGRDQFLAGLVNELEQTNLVLVLGASGSGKSSVVRAGLIPFLWDKWGTRLVNLTLTPDQDPFESLYGSLLSQFKQSEVQFVRAGEVDTLSQLVAALKQLESFWLIFIDQFEEVFTTSDPGKRDRFITSLAQLCKDRSRDRTLKIVATMRADFLDRLDSAPANRLAKLTEKHRPLITQMHPDELRLAIEQPAAHHGVVFEVGLVEEIIKDVQGQAGYLPLLQYTLAMLWETEVADGGIYDRTLNIPSYRRLGGARGALQQRVSQIYQGMSAPEKLAAQRIFLKLVGIGGDTTAETDWKPVRKREARSRFSDALEQTVLTQLINANLLVSDAPAVGAESGATVEIAHEILLTSWDTLRNWIGQNREAIALRNRLNEDMERWKLEKLDDELWSGTKLAKAVDLQKDLTFNQVLGGFGPEATEFIKASVGLRDRQEQEKEARRRRDIRTAWGIAAGAISAAVVTGTAGTFAFVQWHESQKRNILQLVESAKSNFLADQQLNAMIDAVKAGRQSQNLLFGGDTVTAEVTGTLIWITSEIRERNKWRGTQASAASIAFMSDNQESDSQKLVVAGGDGITKIWDLVGNQIDVISTDKEKERRIFLSPDGWQIAIEKLNGIIELKDVSSKKLINQIESQQGGIQDLAISPNNQYVATVGSDGSTKVWDLTRNPATLIYAKEENSYQVAFSPDSQYIATGGDETVKLWDLAGNSITTIDTQQENIENIEFSPNGQRLVTVGAKDSTKLWNLANKTVALIDVTQGIEINANQGTIHSARFSPGRQQLVTAGEDGTIKLWDLAGNPITTLTTYQGSVLSLAFGPNGEWLATGGSDGTSKLWYFDEPITSIKIKQGAIYSTAFSPDSQWLATGGDNGTVKIWDLTGGNPTRIVPTGHESVLNVIFSQREQLATSGSSDEKIKLWDLMGTPISTISTHFQSVTSIAFSPNGRQLATSGNDNIIELWDLMSTKPLPITISTMQDKVWSIVFNPDGDQLATGGENGTIKLWSLEGDRVSEMVKNQEVVFRLAFSSTGDHLATTSNSANLLDSNLTIWDMAGNPISSTPTRQGLVWSIAFSKDGNYIASAGNDGTVKLWDLSGKLIANIEMQKGVVYGVEFSPDGKKLAVSDANGIINLLQVNDISNFKQLLAKSCGWLQDYLHNPIIDLGEADRTLCNSTRADEKK